MDLNSTISTIAAKLPEAANQLIGNASSYIPEELGRVIRHASTYLPAQLDFAAAAHFMLYFTAASLILGGISRVVLGKRSSLNHSLSSAMGIFFLYAAIIVTYTLKPWDLNLSFAPLPFVTLAGDYMIVLPITDAQIPAICTQTLALILLAFLVNLLDTFIPKGKTVIGWYLLRFVSVFLSIALYLGVRWGIHAYLPEALVTYAPTILLILLALMFFSGIINMVLGLMITMANPFLGAMYAFFFSNVVGKQLSKAIFTSFILCIVIYLLDFFGYTVICITAAALTAYIPLAIVLLLLWYLIGHVL